MKEPMTAWVAFLDIYGFKSLFSESRDLTDIAIILQNLKSRAEQEANCGVTCTFFFSDAIVLIQEIKQSARDEFRCIELLVQHLCNEATKLGVALRGSIAHGQMIADDFVCIGNPLIDAYKLEQQLGIPIVVLPEHVCRKADARGFPLFRHIPLKSGIISAFAILPSPIEPFRALAETRLRETAECGPASVASVWRKTVDFCSEVIGENKHAG